MLPLLNNELRQSCFPAYNCHQPSRKLLSALYITNCKYTSFIYSFTSSSPKWSLSLFVHSLLSGSSGVRYTYAFVTVDKILTICLISVTKRNWLISGIVVSSIIFLTVNQ